jgi:large subunit ribosomal protein L32
MAVPKKRTPSSKKNMRRSHHALRPQHFGKCPRCGSPVPGHTACPNCGSYNGRDVINVLAQLNKKERKNKAKARQTGQA